MDTDVTMVTAGEASSSSSRKPKRFEIKKWNAVALWAWGIISWIFALSVKQIKRVLQARSALLPGGPFNVKAFKDLRRGDGGCVQGKEMIKVCVLFAVNLLRCAKRLGFLLPQVCAIMPSTSTVSADGSKPAKCALLIIASGSSRSMATKIDGASRTAGWASFRPALGIRPSLCYEMLCSLVYCLCAQIHVTIRFVVVQSRSGDLFSPNANTQCQIVLAADCSMSHLNWLPTHSTIFEKKKAGLVPGAFSLSLITNILGDVRNFPRKV
ncbi:hypothetical protein POTOM_001373 [Populus tomentosa]|uniref:Uncharacterized protein n=1 Tax=Populus tomentosa TaxID=118781 RepID=A0A8X8DHT1_POPTO|nr:hypothetical protein POTOM_001373 [Populus tomentosa]